MKYREKEDSELWTITQTVDYLSDITGLISSDVLEYRLSEGAKLILRPSSTEPKLKLYLSVKRSTEEESLAALDKLSASVNTLFRLENTNC